MIGSFPQGTEEMATIEKNINIVPIIADVLLTDWQKKSGCTIVLTNIECYFTDEVKVSINGDKNILFTQLTPMGEYNVNIPQIRINDMRIITGNTTGKFIFNYSVV